MTDAFTGEVMPWPGVYAPRDFAFCDGQIMSIAQNTALYSIVGTTYGGNGTNTFGIPNLNGRVPIGAGQAPGLSHYRWGEKGGIPEVTLIEENLPEHNHALQATSQLKDNNDPKDNIWARTFPANKIYYSPEPSESLSDMAPGILTEEGQSQSHTNLQPYCVINYCICLEGYYPPRN